MSIISKLRKIIKDFHSNAVIEFPPHVHLGHVSTNIPFLLPDFKISEFLSACKELPIERHEIKAGFLNLFWNTNILPNIQLFEKTQSKNKINIEFLSPNPTGVLHPGHSRNLHTGDSIYKLHKLLGYSIVSEIYINNVGGQMEKYLAALQRYKDGNTLNEFEYKNPYTEQMASRLTYINREDVIDLFLKDVLQYTRSIGIYFDRITLESEIAKGADQTLAQLNKVGAIEIGRIQNQKSEGEVIRLKELDCVLRKSDGVNTYLLNDIVYACHKSKEFDITICVLGEDHIGHLNNVNHAQKLLGYKPTVMKKYAITTVNGGKMSKRAGNVVPLMSINTETRNEMICQIFRQKFDKAIDFQLTITENDVKFSNTSLKMMYYIQYVHARSLSVITSAQECNKITTPLEEDIFRRIVYFSSVVESSIQDYNTHRLFDFAYHIIMKAYDYLKTDAKCTALIIKIHQVCLVLSQVFCLNLDYDDEDDTQEILDQIQKSKLYSNKPQ